MEIKQESIDIEQNEKNKYYFSKDIIIMTVNDLVYSADAYILDVINAKASLISEDDRLMLESMLFEIFDDKTICPEITIMKDDFDCLKLRSEDPYKSNISDLDLVAILVKTKKKHIITRDAWNYLIERYPDIIAGVVPSVINWNIADFASETNYLLIDDTNMMPFNERMVVELIMSKDKLNVITADTGKNIIQKLVYEKQSELENMIQIVFVTSEFGNLKVMPLLFGMWFPQSQLLDNIMEHVIYKNTIIQDTIINHREAHELELIFGNSQDEDSGILPYILIDLWNPNIEEDLRKLNMYYEQLEKIKRDSSVKF